MINIQKIVREENRKKISHITQSSIIQYPHHHTLLKCWAELRYWLDIVEKKVTTDILKEVSTTAVT